MRAIAFFALASVAGGAVVFLACGSDDTSGASSSSSSGSGSSSSGATVTDAGIVVPEGGTLSSDGKCIIFCSPYKKAGKIASLPRDASAPQVAWTNPEGAADQDTSLATVTLKEGEESQYLAVSDFDFSEVGDDKETWGVQVELTRQSDDGGVGDALIEVMIDGQQDKVKPKILVQPKTESALQGWPRVKIGTHHYGQAIDTWNTNLNPSDVRKPTFGARIAAKRLPGITSDPVVGTVDALKVSVCSCVPGSALKK